MNVEEKLLRGTKGTNGRGQTEKGKVAKYEEGHVLSITHPCIVGKDRAQQEITIILFILFFFFGGVAIPSPVFYFASNYSSSLEYCLDGEDGSGMV